MFFSFIKLSKLKEKKCQKRKSSQGVHFWGANTPDLHQQIISVLWQWHPEKRVEYQVDPLKCSLLFLKEVLQFPGKIFKLNYRHYNQQFLFFSTHFLKTISLFRKTFFLNILPSCRVSIQKWFVIKGGL